jgi:hypothetical protein
MRQSLKKRKQEISDKALILADLWVTGTPSYQFKPLRGPNEIRILELLPSKGQYRSLECTIRHINYSEGGYQALSYVWGSEDRPFRLKVQDVAGAPLGYIRITSNLKNALHDLRSATELKSKVFWIDQICINQASVEKNHQVQLMGEIYQNATRVITYIGPAAQDRLVEKDGIQCLEQLYQHFKPAYRQFNEFGYLQIAYFARETLSVRQIPAELLGATKATWTWLAELVVGNWTTRLWMVQEQILNSELAMLHGTRLLSWDAVAALSAMFYLEILPRKYVEQYWEEHYRDSPRTYYGIATSIWSVSTARRKRYQALSSTTHLSPSKDLRVQIRAQILPTRSTASLEPTDRIVASTQPTQPVFNSEVSILESAPPWSKGLLENMCNFEELECSDLRDRIYALLAISNDSTAGLPVTLNYSDTNSPERLYHQLSIAELKRRDNLSSLSFACRWDNSNLSLPSWALNVRRPPETEAYWLQPASPHPRCKLCEKTMPYFRMNDTVLVLKGCIVDHISLGVPPNYYSSSYIRNVKNASYAKTLMQGMSAYFTMLSKVVLTIERLYHMAFVVMADVEWPSPGGEGNPTEEAVFSFWCFLRYSMRHLEIISAQAVYDVSKLSRVSEYWIQKMAPLVLKESQLDDFSVHAKISTRDNKIALKFWERVPSRGRSLCLTKRNRICNAMHEIKEGDAIVAFQGANRLFVLRPVGTRYRLIGDAFVEGLMGGQAYEGLDPDVVDYDIELI